MYCCTDTEELIESTHCGDLDEVTRLLKNGVDVNSTSRDDESTALHVAAEKGYQDIVLILLKNGAVNQLNHARKTPLHLAAKHGHADVVLALIEYNVDINAIGWSGWTALHEAVSGGHSDVVKILLEYGADVSVQDYDGGAALHYAVYDDINIDMIIDLLNFEADINIRNYNSNTPLHCAAHIGTLGCAKILLERGANCNLRNDKGDTPLDEAIRQNHQDLVALLTPEES